MIPMENDLADAIEEAMEKARRGRCPDFIRRLGGKIHGILYITVYTPGTTEMVQRLRLLLVDERLHCQRHPGAYILYCRMGGQAIYVIPRLDTVVVFTGGNYTNIHGMEKTQFFLETYILKSIL